MKDKDLKFIVDVFIGYWREKGLLDLVGKTGYMPPISLEKFKEVVKAKTKDELISLLNKFGEKGLIMLLDTWVYPGHKAVPYVKNKVKNNQ